MTAITSTMTYHDIQDEGITASCQKAILDAIKSAPTALTRREIAVRTGLETGCVAGRVNELIAAGKLQETGVRKCLVSGRTAKEVALV